MIGFLSMLYENDIFEKCVLWRSLVYMIKMTNIRYDMLLDVHIKINCNFYKFQIINRFYSLEFNTIGHQQFRKASACNSNLAESIMFSNFDK